MRVAIFGSRNLTNEKFIRNSLQDFLDRMYSTYGPNINMTFLHGGSKGAQETAINVIKSEDPANAVDTVLFKPWHMVDNKIPFHTKLFFMRNKQIIDNSDRVVIIRNDEKDSEVDRAADYAEKRGKEVVTFWYDGSDG